MRFYSALDNYRQLLARVDDCCREIRGKYAQHIACKKGCDMCCRHISVFAVEAAALVSALEELPHESFLHIREKSRTVSEKDCCPLLEGGVCLLYDSRPIICRTHGFPLLIIQDGRQQVDFCPLNFQKFSSFPGHALIDLEKLNQTLSAINFVFAAQYQKIFPKERFSIAEAVLKSGKEI